MRRNRILWLGLACLVLLLFITFVGPYLPIVDQALEKDQVRIIDGKIQRLPFPPSSLNWLGTDMQGRDLLSLIVMGAKETLGAVFIIAIVRFGIAIPLGMIASRYALAYWGIQKGNQLITSIPTIFAAILLIKLPFVHLSDQRTLWFILIIALLEVGRISTILHQQVQTLSASPFVESGVMVGNGTAGLYRRYYLPYIFPQMIVTFVLDLAKIMLLLGQLGFLSIFLSYQFITYDLGIGQLLNTSIAWPQLLADSHVQIRNHFWIPFWPSAAIAFTILTFNFLGEGLRQHLENRASSKYNRKLEQQVLEEMNSRVEGKAI